MAAFAERALKFFFPAHIGPHTNGLTLSAAAHILQHFQECSTESEPVEVEAVPVPEDSPYRNEVCAICLRKLSKRDPRMLHCGHVFHRRCLHQLHYHRRNLTGSVHCPMCRAVVPTMKLAPSEDSHEGAKSKLSLWDLHADLKELQERRRMLECNIINVRCCSSLVIVLLY